VTYAIARDDHHGTLTGTCTTFSSGFLHRDFDEPALPSRPYPPPVSGSWLFSQNLPDARLAKYNDLDVRSWTLAPVLRTAAERIA